MKTNKEYSDTIKREVEVDVDALLAAINEISESEVRLSLIHISEPTRH